LIKFWSKIVAIGIALLLVSNTGNGQSPVFRTHKFGKTKNIPKVNCVGSDQNNNIYFGTDQGLIYYNGIDYSTIELPDSISNEKISSIAVGNEITWIGTNSGKILTLKNNKIGLFEHQEFEPSAKISAILLMEENAIFATYGDGVYILNENQQLIHASSETGLNDDYTYDLLADQNSFWVATDAGIAQLSLNGENESQFRMTDGLPDNIVHSLARLNDDSFLVGMYDFGIGIFNTKSNTYSGIFEADFDWNLGPIEDIIVEDKDLIWVATKNEGLVKIMFDGSSFKLRCYSEINGLISNKINCLYKDIDDNIWIGAQFGASLYSGSMFEFIGENEGLKGNTVFDVYKDANGDIWNTTPNGVYKIGYTLSGEPENTQILNFEESNIQQVVTIFHDSKTNIWFGSYGSGLIRYNKLNGKVDLYSKKDGLNNSNILDIEEDKNGKLWLASLGGGLIRVDDPQTEPKFTSVGEDWEDISSYIYALHLDQNQLLWLATDGSGLKAYDCSSNHLKPLVIEGLENKTIYSIASDKKGSIWFTISEEGLFKLDQGQIQKIDQKFGLKSNDILNVVSLDNGAIAAVHSQGVDVLYNDRDKFICYQIDKKDYIFEPNLNACSVRGNTLMIGTEFGIVQFNAPAESSFIKAPKVYINQMLVMQKPTSISGNLEFGYNENHIVLSYLGSWMKKPESITYKYILEGFDNHWSYDTKNLIANYSSLPPGNYVFKVKAKTDEGIWSYEDLATVSFTILKPFWKKWWFYLILVALSASLIIMYVRARTKKLIADKQMLENEVHKRTEEIRHQKNIIEHKNTEILSSITYAKRIQEAILPSTKLMKEHLKECFILYKPKDIVAGDFYWFDQIDDVVIIAVADCTGHGVPGAMVSVVCSNALNKAVREFGETVPSKILDKTLELVVDQFSKSEEDVKDGMDIAMCSINLKTYELQYAGANNPLWINKRNSESPLLEIKATKQPIGKYALAKKYENHVFQLEKGDTFYLFSDGFPDQFGGEKGKKLKAKAFKELLLSIRDNTMEEQHQTIDNYFENWRGDLEQIDDVCVIGVRV